MKSQWIRIFFIGEHGKGSTSSKFNTRIGRNQKLGIKLEEEKKKALSSPPLSFFLPFFPADTNLLLLRLLLVVDKEVFRSRCRRRITCQKKGRPTVAETARPQAFSATFFFFFFNPQLILEIYITFI